MKKKSIVLLILLASSFSVYALTMGEKLIFKQLRDEIPSVPLILTDNLKTKISKATSMALKTENRFSPDSLLYNLLIDEKLSPRCSWYIIGTIIRRNKLQKKQIKPLINFMIQAVDSNNNIQATASLVRTLTLRYGGPELYDSKSKRIIKNIILQEKINPLTIDAVGLYPDKEIIKFLHQQSKKLIRKIHNHSYMLRKPLLAITILARHGNKEAINKLRTLAQNISTKDSTVMCYLPLCLSYTNNKDMVEVLFDLLKSDIKKFSGYDCIPKERQVTHEAACAIYVTVKGFPKYGYFQKFTAKDKEKCLNWVKEHRGKYRLHNHPTQYYLKNTRFELIH
jgi:hypothetical protein